MPCYTRVLIELADDEFHRQARRKLGLPERGGLGEGDARRVRVEAGILKATASVRRLNPTAVVRRVGDKLTVSVSI